MDLMVSTVTVTSTSVCSVLALVSGHPGEKVAWRKSGVWKTDREDEVESRKKLDEQRRKLQKELQYIEKFSCVPKEFQENLKSNLQQQLQEVEQRRHDFMPEHQKVQRISQKIRNIQDEKKKFAERQYRSRRGDAEAQEEHKQKEEAYPFSFEQSR